MKTCCICGSGKPHITIGWPYCLNEFFHGPRVKGLAAYRYRGHHRVSQ